jgi:hypothetical protein
VRRKSWGATFSIPAVFPKFLTTYQTTFSVRPLSQTTPFLLMEQPTGGGSRFLKPLVNSLLDPIGHGHRPDVATFSDQVDDCPVFLEALKVVKI